MSNFLQQLREQQMKRMNQDATSSESQPVPAVPVAESESIPGTASVHTDGAIPAESPSAPAPQAQAPGNSFLARLARTSGAPAPSSSNDSESVPAGATGFDLSGGEDDSVDTDRNDSDGLGDAPVNAATVVEAGSDAGSTSVADLFKLRLAALDELCQTESGITPLIHDTVKSHVRAIMVDLRENPEMRGLLLDQDMHNIMMFIQSSTTIQDTKIEKVAVKREKTKKTAQISASFDDAFAMIDNVPSLESLGNKSTDNIQAKVR